MELFFTVHLSSLFVNLPSLPVTGYVRKENSTQVWGAYSGYFSELTGVQPWSWGKIRELDQQAKSWDSPE